MSNSSFGANHWVREESFQTMVIQPNTYLARELVHATDSPGIRKVRNFSVYLTPTLPNLGPCAPIVFCFYIQRELQPGQSPAILNFPAVANSAVTLMNHVGDGICGSGMETVSQTRHPRYVSPLTRIIQSGDSLWVAFGLPPESPSEANAAASLSWEVAYG
jgi:hypothetical protein